MKAQKKTAKNKVNGLNGKNGSTKVLSATSPMVEPNGKPVRASIPEELVALEEAGQKKADKKKLKIKLKDKKSSNKALAAAFPMIKLIDEQVRTSIPEELVAKVKAAKSKKYIISSNYPYPKQMKTSDYLEEIELLQIELVKMQAWVKEVGERIEMCIRDKV